MTARTIGVLVFEGFQILDAAGPIGAFEIAGRYVDDAYDIRLLAADAGPVRSSSGVTMTAEALADAGPLDTLVVAGGEGSRADRLDPRLLAFARAAGKTARRTTSVC